MADLTIATLNCKQAVAPRQKMADLWAWMGDGLGADIVVFTEAKIPANGVPAGWSAQWLEGGVGHRRRWGTVVAARGFEVVPTRFARKMTADPSSRPNPATTFTVDVRDGREVALRVTGHYGLMDRGEMNGHMALDLLKNELMDVIDEHGDDNLVVAGDFNLWPMFVLDEMEEFELPDVTDLRTSFPELDDPMGGSRIWTHKNGPLKANGVIQELDYIFISPLFEDGVTDVTGGVDDHPESWEMSDHAPVTVTFGR